MANTNLEQIAIKQAKKESIQAAIGETPLIGLGAFATLLGKDALIHGMVNSNNYDKCLGAAAIIAGITVMLDSGKEAIKYLKEAIKYNKIK